MSTTNADGTAHRQYNGQAVKMTDVNGVQKIIQHDYLGNISAVCEISPTNLQGDTPVACGGDIPATGYLTTYTYDLPNHKTTITQGAQQRVFQTDAAGRTVYTSEPERGVTTYSYVYNGTGLLVTRTRPRANQTNPAVLTHTTTQYDSLGRVVNVAYDDGTPTKAYLYDTSAAWSESQTNLHGLLSRASVPSAATIFSYDLMGGATATVQCFPSGCGNGARDKTVSYGYDYVGNTTYVSDPLGQTTSYTYSPAGEITSINNSWVDPTHPAVLVSNVKNGPFGPTSWTLGNGLTGVAAYDALGRPSGGWVCSGSTQPNCSGSGSVYGYVTNWQGVRVTGGSDSIMGTSSYGYDEFNRLASFSTGSNSFSETYDRYGNRWAQTVTAGSGPSFSTSFSTSTNQVSTNSFDAAGNMINDGFHAYQYDAEGNLRLVDGGATATYTYDALNQRIRQDLPNYSQEFLFSKDGQRISIWNPLNDSWYGWQTYWGSKPLAFDYNWGIHFQHQNWLGTERMHTAYDGSVDATYRSLPFGDGYSDSGTDYDQYSFAGLDFDGISYTEHAQFRQYSSTQGRWMSPDPYDGSYHLGNPQSFNRYSYVRDNPLGFVDPLGLYPQCITVADSTTVSSDGSDDVVQPSETFCFENGAGGGGQVGGGGGGGGGSPFQWTPPPQNICPSSTMQKIYAGVIATAFSSQFNLAEDAAQKTGGTAIFGISGSGSGGLPFYPAVGRAVSGQVAIAVDSQGNVALLLSISFGLSRGTGAAGGADIGISRSPTVYGMSGPSFSVGFGGGDGFGGAVQGSNNGGGTVTATVGAGVGGYGPYGTYGPTKVIPLVCHVP